MEKRQLKSVVSKCLVLLTYTNGERELISLPLNQPARDSVGQLVFDTHSCGPFRPSELHIKQQLFPTHRRTLENKANTHTRTRTHANRAHAHTHTQNVFVCICLFVYLCTCEFSCRMYTQRLVCVCVNWIRVRVCVCVLAALISLPLAALI